MSDLALPAVPLAALAFVTLVGAGVASALAGRFPLDAQAALAPVAGTAIVAAASPLLPLGVAAKPLAVGVTVVGAAVTLGFRRQVARSLRAGAAPLLVAAVAVLLAAAPALARGDWRVTSLYGSTDAYHWTSQARAYLEGPAPQPASEHPDRVTYERSRTQHWAVALPFGLLQISWISGADPADAYGALSAIVFCLLPLTAYVAARAVLGWSARLAAATGLALVANAALLFATHFSWQQQLAGSAFAFGAAVLLYAGLGEGARRSELALAALLAAGALATYRLGFAPYFAALLAIVTLSRMWRGRPGPTLRRLAPFALLGGAIAAPSLAAVGNGLPDFVASGGFSTEFKRSFPAGQLAEGVGLVPNVWALETGWPHAAELAWLAVGSAVAAVLLVLAFRELRSGRARGRPFLIAGGILAVGGYCLLILPSFAPYLSFKLLSYTAPFLVLLALLPLAGGKGRVPLLAAAALAAGSASVATVLAAEDVVTPGGLAELKAVSARLPDGAVVSVALDDPWEQAWALYYLRDRRLSVEEPSFLLTGQGLTRSAASYRRPADYVLAHHARDRAVWRDGDLALVRLS